MGKFTAFQTGRHQGRCGEGHCAIGAELGRSKLEADIFNLLDLALGPGVHDATVFSAIGRLRLDMLFRHDGNALVIEYDGAYFHQDRIDTDRRKADVLRRHESNLDWYVHVLRIRERPLRRLHPHDVTVPARPSAQQCARLAVLHLLHTAQRGRRGGGMHELGRRMHCFIQAGPPLDPQTVDCRPCQRLEQAIIDSSRRSWGWRDPFSVLSAADALAERRDRLRVTDEQSVNAAGAALTDQ